MSGRVLIVEDDETIGAVMARALGAEGYETRWVRSGEAALTSLDGVVLVLLDLGLPGLDGVEVCRRIRRIDATLPVIMFSSGTKDEPAGGSRMSFPPESPLPR